MALDNLTQHLGQKSRKILIDLGFASLSAVRVKIPIIGQGIICPLYTPPTPRD